MASVDRSLDIVAFVSEHFRDILRRRLSELAGLALLTLALLGAIALATWSVQDPSLSHATQKPVHNLLGFPGAVFSDLAMQLLGLSAVMLLAPEVLLGWKLLAHRPLGQKWRAVLWIFAAFLFAGFASTLPRIGSWPLPTGLGGVVGDAMLSLPNFAFGGPPSGIMLVLASLFFGVATVLSVMLAAGWGSQQAVAQPSRRNAIEDEDIDDEDTGDDHASAWIGMIVHALLSWKARIGRLIGRNARTPLPTRMPVPSGGRTEPRFDTFGRVPLAPDAEISPTRMTIRNRRGAAARHRARPCAAPTAVSCCPRSIC